MLSSKKVKKKSVITVNFGFRIFKISAKLESNKKESTKSINQKNQNVSITKGNKKI